MAKHAEANFRNINIILPRLVPCSETGTKVARLTIVMEVQNDRRLSPNGDIIHTVHRMLDDNAVKKTESQFASWTELVEAIVDAIFVNRDFDPTKTQLLTKRERTKDETKY